MALSSADRWPDQAAHPARHRTDAPLPTWAAAQQTTPTSLTGAVVSATPSTVPSASLTDLLVDIRACEVCELPHGPRPIVQAGSGARITIIGQAPGRRVHESGIPWDDPSGRTLRRWLQLSEAQFYDPDIVAIVPMGFCYPGSASSGDNPPRPECAPLWHERVLAELPNERLEIIIGMYAQKRYIPDRERTLTATVANWRSYMPERVVLPHPSPRNQHWLTKNPWFEDETLPAVRARVEAFLAG